MRRTYYIWTIGCQMNGADTRYMASRLEALGYQPAANVHLADVIVLNTCVIRQQAEDKAIEQLRQLKGLKRHRPEVIVAVMGCMVGRKPEKSLRENFPFVDIFMRPSETTPLIHYLQGNDEVSCGYSLPISQRGNIVTAAIPVVLGCSHTCSYCVIPSRRGGEQSRTKDEILREVEELASEGVKEITLLGQIVDRYGVDFDHGADLSDLLAAVSGVDDIARVRFLTNHPNWFTDKLLETMTMIEKICPCVEIPVQSGNDEVLAHMQRGYTVETYRRLVDKIRNRIPNIAINTDVIVGFPGESEAQFMDTLHLMADLRFDMAHIARYSERPGTPAARNLKDDVPEVEKEHRRDRLEQLLKDTLEKKHRSLAGQKLEVLIEKRSGRQWKGRTPHNKVVLIDDERDLHGQMVDVVITRTGAFSLFGKIAS